MNQPAEEAEEVSEFNTKNEEQKTNEPVKESQTPS